MFRSLIPWTRSVAKKEGDSVRKDRALTLRDGLAATVEEFDRLFNDVFDDFGLSSLRESTFSPKINLSETDGEYRVTAELPGLEPDKVNIELKDKTLILTGNKEHRNEEKNENYHRVECSYGSFTRAIPLPEAIKEEDIEAKYRDGVLTISIPKSEEAKKTVKKIEIKS